jgi:hypothetical protein
MSNGKPECFGFSAAESAATRPLRGYCAFEHHGNPEGRPKLQQITLLDFGSDINLGIGGIEVEASPLIEDHGASLAAVKGGRSGDTTMVSPKAMSAAASPSTSTASPAQSPRSRGDGVDGLVFTGRVGENSPRMRAATTRATAFLGVDSTRRGTTMPPTMDFSPPSSEVSIVLVGAREDLEIAAQVRSVLGAPGGRSGGRRRCDVQP